MGLVSGEAGSHEYDGQELVATGKGIYFDRPSTFEGGGVADRICNVNVTSAMSPNITALFAMAQRCFCYRNGRGRILGLSHWLSARLHVAGNIARQTGKIRCLVQAEAGAPGGAFC